MHIRGFRKFRLFSVVLDLLIWTWRMRLVNGYRQHNRRHYIQGRWVYPIPSWEMKSLHVPTESCCIIGYRDYALVTTRVPLHHGILYVCLFACPSNFILIGSLGMPSYHLKTVSSTVMKNKTKLAEIVVQIPTQILDGSQDNGLRENLILFLFCLWIRTFKWEKKF